MAKRRRNLKDLLTPDPTPDKINTYKSGWCMTEHHDGCRKQFTFGICPCDCHSQTQRTQRAREKNANNDDPRPWRK